MFAPSLRRTAAVAVALIVVATLGVFAGAASSSADSDPKLGAFAGAWELTESERSNASRESAIDGAVADLSWIMRKMATPQLKGSTSPPPNMQFYWVGDQLFQRVPEKDGQVERPVDLGGAVGKTRTPDGKEFGLKWTIDAGVLVLNWTQDQAYGENRYRIDGATDRLVVEQMIQITAISDVSPILFESRFDRASPPEVSSDVARGDSQPRP